MRSDAREVAFKTIFSGLLGGGLGKTARANLYLKAKLNDEEKMFAERLVSVTQEHLEELSAEISAAVTRFADYRIYPADKAIMLIALAEIKYFDEIPPVVSVSEAAALARAYSTEKSADFVNGVLGGIINA